VEFRGFLEDLFDGGITVDREGELSVPLIFGNVPAWARMQAVTLAKGESFQEVPFSYRVLMTGCVLLREGLVEANLLALNVRWEFPFLEEWARVKALQELGTREEDRPDVGAFEALEAELDRAFAESRLPEAPGVREELDRLLVRARGRRIGE